MLPKALAALLVAVPLGVAAPASAQTTPSPTSSGSSSPMGTPTGTPTPDATARALRAYDLFVADVRYEPVGTDGTLAVSLFGPPGPEMPDQIAAVVWASEQLRFSTLVVRWPTGHVDRTYADLQAALGPRPAGFDQSNVLVALLLGSGPWDLDLAPLGWFLAAAVIAVVVAVTLLVVLFVGVVVFVVRRRRRWTAASST